MYVCNYVKTSTSYAQIIFPASFANQRVLNKDPTVWLDGAIPPPKVVVTNFNLKLNGLFANIQKKLAK